MIPDRVSPYTKATDQPTVADIGIEHGRIELSWGLEWRSVVPFPLCL